MCAMFALAEVDQQDRFGSLILKRVLLILEGEEQNFQCLSDLQTVGIPREDRLDSNSSKRGHAKKIRLAV